MPFIYAGPGDEYALALAPVLALALSFLRFPGRHALLGALAGLFLILSALALSIGDARSEPFGILSFTYLASAAFVAAFEHATGGRDG
ncbi:hypothetical protein L0Y65_00920 [Candidatus Micrarchaeota archaeon]|nr:hypothetical protein [Candidatus Micrarchaeota archaeon]